MLEDILKAEAEILHRQYARPTTDDFLRRLAVRITEEAHRPARVQHAHLQGEPVPTAHDGTSRAPGVPAQVAAPAQAPATRTTRPPASPRPRIRRHLRRRPTPIVASDPSVNPTAVMAYLRWLCDIVLRSHDIDRLSQFAVDYDQVGARTFACLLYSLDRKESALFWWRFAAGAGDPLAAHLLAVHHAADGRTADARLWRACARMLGFDSDQDIPHAVRPECATAEGFVPKVPWDEQRQEFLRSSCLPGGLISR
ncbi:hypothetical protein [Streptomyces sp. IBSNAI001]|uniref:hypothetical protein n=1 Tax=Streptomyces sp. IBSNAI001 TaxID=3457499 RepID=UPI003FD1DB61